MGNLQQHFDTISHTRMSSWYFHQAKLRLPDRFFNVMCSIRPEPYQAKKEDTPAIIFQIHCVLQKSFDNPKQWKSGRPLSVVLTTKKGAPANITKQCNEYTLPMSNKCAIFTILMGAIIAATVAAAPIFP